MYKELFFRDRKFPFAEGRYTKSSRRNFKAHMHTTFSVGGIDQGRVEYDVAGRSAILSPGSLALINPGTLHSCNTLHHEERSYYMLYLDIDWCCQVQRSLWQIDSFLPVKKIQLDDAPLYHRYCKVMQNLMGTLVHRSEKEQLLFDLAVEIFSRGCEQQIESEITGGHIDWLKKCLGQNLRQDLTLVSLAEKLEVNPYTLLRRFKAVTGITPHAYRMNCRIEQARRFLSQGMDIADTALECGFFDQSHLHRHFKAATTVTPREYRVNFIQYLE